MPQHPTSWKTILILFSNLSPKRFFSSCLPNKTLYTTLLSPYVPHAPPFLFLYMCSSEYLVKIRIISSSLCSLLYPSYFFPLRTKYPPQDPILKHCVTTQKSQVLIYLEAEARNHAPSVYVPPSVRATKFHTHTKLQAKLQSCII